MSSRANSPIAVIRRAVTALPPGNRLVLAVSGGRDSMTMLDAFARWQPGAIAAVATFDHGTGKAATAAAELVRQAAHAIGAPFAHGRAQGLEATEAAWRSARWAFLGETAALLGARVATAHTRDDQLETVFMRALRGAGARGLAGLYAESRVVRPLLEVTSADVARYAHSRGIAFVHDPSNQSRAYLRNRVRLDLLPALEHAQPGFGDGLLALARAAAECRASIERHVDTFALRREGASTFVSAAVFVDCDDRTLCELWPAVAARAGVTLDRRGTQRLAQFTMNRTQPGRIQIAGRHEVVRHARSFEIRPAPRSPTVPGAHQVATSGTYGTRHS